MMKSFTHSSFLDYTYYQFVLEVHILISQIKIYLPKRAQWFTAIRNKPQITQLIPHNTNI